MQINDGGSQQGVLVLKGCWVLGGWTRKALESMACTQSLLPYHISDQTSPGWQFQG